MDLMHQVTHVSKVYTFDTWVPMYQKFIFLVQWHPVFLRPQYGTCFLSPFFPIEFLDCFLIFWKIFRPLFIIMQQKQTGLFLYW